MILSLDTETLWCLITYYVYVNCIFTVVLLVSISLHSHHPSFSLPSEVCTVISDADCITPMETVCSAATPSPDCQIILRQFFNDSGVFCINVSLTNDVSLAVASARVSVTVASGGSPGGTAATVLGVMVLACVVCCVGLMYRRFKQYQPLREDQGDGNGGSSQVTSVPLLLWNLLSRQSPGESRPLLQGRMVWISSSARALSVYNIRKNINFIHIRKYYNPCSMY